MQANSSKQVRKGPIRVVVELWLPLYVGEDSQARLRQSK
jgi:hypothetical protein